MPRSHFSKTKNYEKTKIIAANKSYTAVDIGKLDEVEQYSLIHPKFNTVIEGKVFLKRFKSLEKNLNFRSDIRYIVIQSKENSLEQHTTVDGIRIENESKL